MTAGEDTGAVPHPRPRLSPERVRAHEFSRASLGRRGYDEQEVREFIGRVAEDIAAGDAERMNLRSEIERLRSRFRDRQADPEPQPGPPPAEAVNLLSAAQQQADAYVAQAQEYCRQVTSQAKKQAEEIVDEARSHAEAAAETAMRDYRAGAGTRNSAELEELERRAAWLQSFCHAVQIQMQAASDAFSREISRLGDFSAGGPGDFPSAGPPRSAPLPDPEAAAGGRSAPHRPRT